MILPPVDFSSSSASIRASRSIASHTHGKLSVWSNCHPFQRDSTKRCQFENSLLLSSVNLRHKFPTPEISICYKPKISWTGLV